VANYSSLFLEKRMRNQKHSSGKVLVLNIAKSTDNKHACYTRKWQA